jgi:hypothetical protein
MEHPHANEHDHAPGTGPNGSASFDEQAATWDEDPAKVERSAVVAAAIIATVPLSSATRMLEYGAGTGLVTRRCGTTWDR